MGDLRQWVLLARSWRLRARHGSEEKPRVLGREDYSESGTGSREGGSIEAHGLRSNYRLGM
jgi:hypothetical protein